MGCLYMFIVIRLCTAAVNWQVFAINYYYFASARKNLGCAGSGRRLESHWTLLVVWCARLDRDPAHCAHGFGQQVASLVLWFGLDDCVIDRINREATRTPMPSPH